MYKYILTLAVAFMALTGVASAEKIFTKNNVAVSGYDTVAYFTQSKPVKGNANYSAEHKGAKYLFSSQEHLDLFKANPAKYAPQYGGYCAFAVAHGQTAPADPEQWHIEDGKLYLNLNAKIKKRWLPKRDVFIPRADAKYPNL